MDINSARTPSQGIKPEHLARILNADKLILNSASDLCFKRCILSFEKEYLNPLEQNCVDRCISKYDQMVREVLQSSASTA